MEPGELTQRLELIRNSTWAIVYSYQPPRDNRSRWYDRWRYDVLNGYVEAVAMLGAEPLICDVDNFHELISKKHTDITLVINLNSGATPLQNLSYVPTISAWYDIPCFPNDSDVLLIGERKDIAKQIAEKYFPIPASISSSAIIDGPLVGKPVTGGNSRGVTLFSSYPEVPHDLNVKYGSNGFMLEQFIPGNEVTVPFYRCSCTGDIVVCPPVVYALPSNERDWIYTHEMKMSKKYKVPRYLGVISDELKSNIRQYAENIGTNSIGRIDFRQNEGVNSDKNYAITKNDLVFLEINVLPTLLQDGNFLQSVQRLLEESDQAVEQYFRNNFPKWISSLAFLLFHFQNQHL